MSAWSAERTRRVSFFLLGVTIFALTGARAITRFVKLSGYGDPCVSDCRPGLFCYEHGLLGYCTEECASDDDCRAGFTCGPAGETSVCKRLPDGEYGHGCFGAEDCRSGLCVQFSVEVRMRDCRFTKCVLPCDDAADCPQGSECRPREDGGAVCLPVAAARREAEEAYSRAARGGTPPLQCL